MLLLRASGEGKLTQRPSISQYVFDLDHPQDLLPSNLALFGQSYITTFTTRDANLTQACRDTDMVVEYDRFGCTSGGKLKQGTALWYRLLQLPRQLKAMYQVCSKNVSIP